MVYPYKTGIVFTLPAIIYNKDLGYGFPPTPGKLGFRTGAKSILKRLAHEGYLCFMIGNLAEVANGTISIEDAHGMLENLQEYYFQEFPFVQIYYAYEPHMPRYLPGTEMIQDIIAEFKQERPRLLMVGATAVCRRTAKDAQLEYCSYENYFSTLVPKRFSECSGSRYDLPTNSESGR